MGGDDGGHSIFVRPDIDLTVFTHCWTALIGLTIVLELLLSRAEHSMHEGPRWAQLIYHKVMKELMILGFISFTIFMGEQAFPEMKASSYYLVLEVSDAHLAAPVVLRPPRLFALISSLTFCLFCLGRKFCHVLIFFMAMFLALNSALFAAFLGLVSNKAATTTTITARACSRNSRLLTLCPSRTPNTRMLH